ncbi:MAG: patatin-like phospholipase family protein [Rubrivivax sp.]|nr:patatin-like phospholipase family protein [Rubrivivax sp.]
MRALQVWAGPRAREHLRQQGLAPGDIAAIPGAAGGAKGLVLNPLDRFLFGHWLAGPSPAGRPLHLIGASIGAWRLACACLPDPDAALAELCEDYITQRYEHAPGKPPTAAAVSRGFRDKLDQRIGARAAQVLSHPQRRLHVFTSRGRHLLRREGRLRTPLGYLGAFVANAASRRALGGWLERVVFSDPRDALPLPLDDFRTAQVTLDEANLVPAILASCSIPFWLQAVHDVPGGPRGAYWDGGITDYHLHLQYAAIPHGDAQGAGLVLYPHFQPHIVPGWLDKGLKHRHRASRSLDNLVVLAPAPDWVRALPGGKLPDRNDFRTYGEDEATRQRIWRAAVAESARLADEFAELVQGGRPIDALPLP